MNLLNLHRSTNKMGGTPKSSHAIIHGGSAKHLFGHGRFSTASSSQSNIHNNVPIPIPLPYLYLYCDAKKTEKIAAASRGDNSVYVNIFLLILCITFGYLVQTFSDEFVRNLIVLQTNEKAHKRNLFRRHLHLENFTLNASDKLGWTNFIIEKLVGTLKHPYFRVK